MSPQLFNLYEPADYSITSLTCLEELDVSDNNDLSRLPDGIRGLKNLKILYLGGCAFTALPDRYVIAPFC